MTNLSRRHVMTSLTALGIVAGDFVRLPGLLAQAPAAPDPALVWPPAVTGISPAFPTHDAVLVKEVVGASHANLERVRELVTRQPTLAKAGWDWGYGDWETALGAASHVGNRPIAEFLLSHGATPTIFSAAMLGHLDVVRAMVAAQPGQQRQRGPHGIPLLAHARAGGAPALPVVEYLEALGDAGDRVATEPLSADVRATLLGTYRFGTGPRDAFVVGERREFLTLMRIGAGSVNLQHRGALAFSTSGSDFVRIVFQRTADRVDAMTIADPDLVLRAMRE
jgi:hypothetical protein